jgi:hypothetical protein
MSKNAAQKILEAVGILKGEDPALVNSILTDAGLEKAAQDLSPSEKVKDRWENGNMHKNPAKEELKFGPSESASGSGAEKMVDHYSHPAKQEGIQLMAEKLGEMFAPMTAHMKAIAEGQTAILAALAPAAKAKKAEGKDEDEEKEVVEVNEDKCKSLLLRAGDLIRKARRMASTAQDFEDDGETAKAKELSVKSRKLRREAGVLLGKARTAAYAAGSEVLKSDIRALAVKGEIKITEDEEEGEDDKEAESDKAKSAPADGAKSAAVTDLKGNQADSKDTKTGNQADHAEKATGPSNDSTIKAVNDALAGIKVLETTVRGLVDVVSGKSKVSDLVPDLSKASPEAISSVAELIAQGEDSGKLTEFDVAYARNVIAKSEAAKRGLVATSVPIDLIAKASPNVRELFSSPALRAVAA